MRKRQVVSFGSAVALVLMLPVGVREVAGAEAKQAAASGAVNPFYGSYQEDIPITVPPFHGIEPKLALHYDSSGPNGLVGVGWSLSGFSTIERASPGKGAPKYDASDIYRRRSSRLVRVIPHG